MFVYTPLELFIFKIKSVLKQSQLFHRNRTAAYIIYICIGMVYSTNNKKKKILKYITVKRYFVCHSPTGAYNALGTYTPIFQKFCVK